MDGQNALYTQRPQCVFCHSILSGNVLRSWTMLSVYILAYTVLSFIMQEVVDVLFT